MNQEPIVRLKNLHKNFGCVKAVEDVCLDIQPGEIFGFLGPNGAGKTTTIAMMLGLIHSSSGQIEIMGEKITPGKTKILGHVGALVGASSAIIPYLSAREHLKLVARLHPDVDARRIEEVLDMVNLSDAAGRKAGKYSTGMKQRLGMAMALVHKPELLILDEPTNGMDPAGMRDMRLLLTRLASEGVTIFLSSHLLHEVEQVCERVALLNNGRVIADGNVATLIKRMTPDMQTQTTNPTNPVINPAGVDLESVFLQLTQTA